MPVIYRIVCTNCGKGPDLSPAVAGFVSINGAPGGSRLPSGYLALAGKTDGTWECLPHPLEQSTLREHGYTYKRAVQEGRLLLVTYRICTECGALFMEAKARKPRSLPIKDCLLGLAVGLAVGFYFRHLGLSIWPVLGLGATSAVFAGSIRKLLGRFIMHPTHTKQDLPTCPTCGATESITIPWPKKIQVPCAACKQGVLKCETAGIS